MSNNLFQDYTNLEFKRLQIMNEKSEIINKELMPKISDEVLLKAYKFMCLSRTQEEIQTKISEGGKNLNFLASSGQEAIEVAYAIQLRKGIDWLVPGYRNNAAWITAGLPIENIYLYWLGNEKGNKVPEDINVLPPNIPIGTQYSHATGIAFAEKFKKSDAVVITTTGDGGSSEGEVYEAMNFASIHKLPVIFFIENNQWSLTTPRYKASATNNLAIRGIGVGIPSIQVDGNDFFSVYKAVEIAIERAKKGEGPSLIEAITYRRFSHSASDIKKDYINEELHPDLKKTYVEIEKEWLDKDPIERLKKYLINNKKWDEKKQKSLDEVNTKLVEDGIAKAIEIKETKLEEIFEYTYASLTPQLKEQLKEAQEYFAKRGKK